MNIIIPQPKSPTSGLAIKLSLDADLGASQAPVLIQGSVASSLQLADDLSVGIQASGSCLVQQVKGGDSYEIVSGALIIQTVPEAAQKFLWPDSGAVQKLLIGPSGLQMEVHSGVAIRRLQLVQWPQDDSPARRWQLLSVENEPDGGPRFQSPAARLDQLQADMKLGGDPIEIVSQFFPREGAVFYDVVGRAVWEVILPTWALKVGGATWDPSFLAVNAAGTTWIFDDRDFTSYDDEAPAQLSPGFQAELRHSDADDTLEKSPALYATGDATEINPNQPYVWHYAPLKRDNAIHYAGAWVRYHLERRPQSPQPIPAGTADGAPRLSRPLELHTAGWTLFVDSSQGRMRLTLTRDNGINGTWQPPQLQVEGARVRALSPALQLCTQALNDPAALPNAWDAGKQRHDVNALLRSTRLEFASNAQPSAPLLSEALQPATLVAKWDSDRFTLTPQPERAPDPAVAMAFVPGPVAGINLVPWSGRNLLTKEQLVGAEPADALPRPPDFNQGLMAVELRKFAWTEIKQEEDGKLKLEMEVVKGHRLDAGGVMALLPWAEWRAGDSATEPTIHPFHRNLIQEFNEFAAGADDLAKNTPELDLGPEERRRRQQADLERAVRDLYAAATVSGLTATNNGDAKVSNWLPGSNAVARISYVPASGDTVPALQVRVNGSDQKLSSDSSNEGGAPWLDTNLSWQLARDSTAAADPQFEVANDLRDGAVHVADSSAPLVFQNGRITALTAYMLKTKEDPGEPEEDVSRLAIILADDLGRVDVWRPLTGQDPDQLHSFNDGRSLRSLALRVKRDLFATLAIGYSGQDTAGIDSVKLSWIAEGPRVDTRQAGALVPMVLNQAQAVKAVMWIEQEDDLITYAGKQAVHFAKASDINARRSVEVAGPIGAFDFRQLGTGGDRRSLLAVAAGKAVHIFGWNGQFKLNNVSTTSKILELTAAAETTGVQLLPFVNALGKPEGVHVIVSTNSADPTQRLLVWRVSLENLEVGGPQKFLSTTVANANIANLSLVKRLSAKVGEANWLLAATTQGDNLGAAEVLCWRLEWEGIENEPRVVSFARGCGHQGSITALSVVSDLAGDYVVTGGRDGTARVWDPESGRELFSTGAPARFYDNLGVVRDLPAAGSRQVANGWRVEKLSLAGPANRRPIRSLSTEGAVSLINDAGTDIQFTCLDLKLHNPDGDKWVPLDDDEPAMALGAYGFYAATAVDTLGQADLWLRLDGAPVFVTRLLSVTFDGASSQPLTLTFTGVLANPAALAAPRAGEEIPASVAEALAREKLITVTLGSRGDTYTVAKVEGEFHWRFTLADQIPVEFGATAFPGRLARLAGAVAWREPEAKLRLIPTPDACLASAFGRLWPLHSCPQLVVGSHSPLGFREKTEDELQVYRTLTANQEPGATADLKRQRDTLLALTAAGDEAQLFDAESGHRLRTISGRHRAVKLAPISASDAALGVGAQGLIASDGGLVRFWQMVAPQPADPAVVPDYRETLRFRLPAEVEAMDAIYGQDGKLYFLFRCADGTGRLWEKGNGQELHTFTLPEAMVTAAAFAPLPEDWPTHWRQLSTGKPTLILALGGSDGSVRVYGVFDPATGLKVVELRQFFDHGSAIGSVSLAKASAVELYGMDGLFLLSCCEEGGLPSLREVVSGREGDEFRTAIMKSGGDLGALTNCVAGAIVHFRQALYVVLSAQQQESSPHLFILLKATKDRDTHNDFVSKLGAPSPIARGSLDLDVLRTSDGTDTSILITGPFIVGSKHTTQVRRFADANDLPADLVVATSPLPVKAAVSIRVINNQTGYLLGIDSAQGTAGLWSAETSPPWKPVPGFIAANARPIKDVAFGELLVPVVLLRLEDDHLGIWDPDLAYLERTEIEVSDSATFAYAYVDGEPHMRVNNGKVDRLWNLALGKPVRDFPADNAEFVFGNLFSADEYVGGDKSVWKLVILDKALSVTKGDVTVSLAGDGQANFACAAFAGKGMQITDGDEPAIVTIDIEAKLQVWRHVAAEGASFVPDLTKPVAVFSAADLTKSSVNVFISGNRPCALVLSSEQAVVCDLETGRPLRTWRLPAQSNATLNWVNLPVAVTAHGDQVRIWDLSSGILRRELKDLPASHLATATVAGQPWIVAGGQNTLQAFNLRTGEAKELHNGGCLAVAATRVSEPGNDNKERLAVVAAVDNETRFWRDADIAVPESVLLANKKASAVALLVRGASTYISAAMSGGIQVWEVAEDTPEKKELAGLSSAQAVTSLALAPSFHDSKLVIAATANGRVTLWDCYDPGGGQPWQSSQWSEDGDGAVAVALAWTADGPRHDGPRLLVAGAKGAHMLIPPSVLRVAAGQTDPVCYLQVKLDDSDTTDGTARLLRGVITPGNKLDLMLTPTELGIREPLHVQSGIIQDDYYGFRVEEPGEQGARGVLVVWDAGPHARRALNGALLLERTEEAAKATVKVGNLTLQWIGPRVRLRRLDFSLSSDSMNAFIQREDLTWRLKGTMGEYTAELLIDEQTWSPNRAGQHAAGFLRLTRENQDIQGHVLLTLSGESETPTITLEPTVFLAQPVENTAVTGTSVTEPFGVTRDDIVIATPGAGLAVDLIPVTRAGTAVQFVTLHDDGTFKIVNAEQIPLNLTFSPEALRSLEKTPISVLQLAHRLAQGGRLRVRRPDGDPVIGEGDASWPPASDQTRWLLAPLLQTPKGVLALSEGLAIAGTHPVGRQRLQTENVLAIQRTVSADGPPVSVANLMTISTLLGVSRADGLVFDDKRVRREIVRAGASGVIVRRVLDADGRVEYSFVNSPFYAHAEAVRELEEKKEPVQLAAPALAMAPKEPKRPKGMDPRLIWRQPADLKLTPGVRYLPERPRPEADRAQVQAGKAPTRTFRIRQADAGEQRQAETGEQRLQVAASTSFEQRLPLDRFANPAAAGRSTFLPKLVELGFGVDKPGAMAHHTLRVRGGDGKSSTYFNSLLDFAHREPQMIVTPKGAAITLKVPIEADDNALHIAWTETLGAVPLDSDLITGEDLDAAIEAYGKALGQDFGLPAPLVQLVQRVGERIVPIAAEDQFIYLPSASTAGERAEVPELYLVSHADLLQKFEVTVDETDDAGNQTQRQISYQLHLLIRKGDKPSHRALSDVLSEEVIAKYRVYQLKSSGENEQTPPVFQQMMREIDLNSGATATMTTLNLIWLAEGVKDLNQAVIVFAKDKTLKPISVDPFAPKVAAVARYATDGAGFLGNWRERTLFLGDAASAAGVEVAMEGETPNQQLVFSASQSISMAAHYRAPGHVFLAKYLDEGQVVYDAASV